MLRYTLYSIPTFLLAVVLALSLTACGETSDDTATDRDTTEEFGEVDREVTIHPRGNRMEFEETEFTVQAGETVRLVFNNTAEAPSMVHNVLILNTDDDAVVERVGMAGQSAGSGAQYVPDDSAVLAHTDVAQPGETVEVTFTAPDEPGSYTYVCTYPGHWAMMQGIMRVEG